MELSAGYVKKIFCYQDELSWKLNRESFKSHELCFFFNVLFNK